MMLATISNTTSSRPVIAATWLREACTIIASRAQRFVADALITA
jgi:hypothetical protein